MARNGGGFDSKREPSHWHVPDLVASSHQNIAMVILFSWVEAYLPIHLGDVGRNNDREISKLDPYGGEAWVKRRTGEQGVVGRTTLSTSSLWRRTLFMSSWWCSTT